MRPGDKDGYGRYGYVDETADRLLCHECGKHYKSLGAHVYGAHGMAADEYRAAHGIPQRIPLVTKAMSQTMSKHASSRVGTEAWQRLVEKRDPTAASRAKTPEAYKLRGDDLARKIETSTRNLAGAKKPITRRCITCGALIKGRKGIDTCSPLCARIATYESKTRAPAKIWMKMHDEGQAWTEIARAYGTTHPNVRYAVNRYVKHLADVEYLREHGPGEVPEKREQA